MPLSLGAHWTYRVEHSTKISIVETLEPVPGTTTQAYRIRSDKGDGGKTLSWQAAMDTQIVRYREEEDGASGLALQVSTYEPYKLRVDDDFATKPVGTTTTTIYQEHLEDAITGTWTSKTKRETWIVESHDETVSVPAGTFSCVRLRRTNEDDAEKTKAYWFARGIGKVKEQGKRVEELLSYSIP